MSGATMNNTGGKTLLGNFVEERYLTENGHDTNINLAATNSALQLQQGNSGIIPKDNLLPMTTEVTSSYANSPGFAVATGGRRAAMLAAAAKSAVSEVDGAAAAADAAAEKDANTWSTTTADAFNRPGDGNSGRGGPDADPRVPITVWSGIDASGAQHQRSQVFTGPDVTKVDGLVATGRL